MASTQPAGLQQCMQGNPEATGTGIQPGSLQRLFLPSEYLHGNWERTPLLPVNSEIQVSLTLQDPGHDAVNYTAGLQSATD